jgi:hypothetical protein
MNKAELLANSRSGRTLLESARAQFDDDRLLAPNLHGGWSIKDLIAHFGFWEGRVITLSGIGSYLDSSNGGISGSGAPSSRRCFRAATGPQ